MYLTRQRLTRFHLGTATMEAFAELFPKGMKVTSERMQRWVRKAPLDVRELAECTFDHRGQERYYDQSIAISRETQVTLEVAQLRAQSTRDAAIARWRERHDVSSSDYLSDEQRAELDEIHAAYSVKINRSQLVRRLRYAALFAELAPEHGLERFMNKPIYPKLKDGEVLITHQTLAALGSCETYIERFQQKFPEGAVITEEVCVENKDVFDWSWAANRMLAPGRVNNWETLRRELIGAQNVQERRVQARETFDRRVREIDAAYGAGLITSVQRSTKIHEVERRYMEHGETLSSGEVVASATAFARVYAEHPRPGLAELAED